MIPSLESPFLARSTSPAALGSALAAIGREHPVIFDELMAAPLVLRHKDVAAALRDTATFSTQFYGMGPMSTAMIAHDGAEHARQRRIHNRFFSAAASARYAEIVEPVAWQAFGRLTGKGDSELIGDVISAYPMKVFLELLGLPDDIGEQGLVWVRQIVSWLGSPMNEELADPGLKAFAELSEYTSRLVERERAHPGDNMLGEIVKAHVDEGEYTPEAVTVAVVSLLLGGFETTIQMLTGTIASLLFNPEAMQRVRAESSLLDAALDEAFRWASPSAGLYRLVMRNTEIAGTPVAAGSMVYLAIAARTSTMPPIPTRALSPWAATVHTSASASARTTASAHPWPASKPAPPWPPCWRQPPACALTRQRRPRSTTVPAASSSTAPTNSGCCSSGTRWRSPGCPGALRW